MSADKVRDAFEAFSIGPDGEWTPRGIGRKDAKGNYGNVAIAGQWEAWQAATATQAAEIARLTQELAGAKSAIAQLVYENDGLTQELAEAKAAPVPAQGVLTDDHIEDIATDYYDGCSDRLYDVIGFARAILAAQAPASDALDVKVIDIGHGATLQRQAKTTGVVGWLMYNEHGLVRSLNALEILLVESALKSSAIAALKEQK